MSKILGQYAVHGVRDDDNVARSFLPGDEVPEWAAKQLGDHCFDDYDWDEDGGSAAGPVHVEGGAPPRTGRGSGIDAWRDYAIDQELDIEQDWSKEKIIDELEAAGKL